MKKILLTFALVLAGLTAQAAITVHVKADVAPYIWAWTSAGNVFASEGWPGHQLTEKKSVQGTEFWYYTFDESITTVNFLFNDGGANGAVKQTRDVNGVTTDRFFIYDGESTIEDVTEQYGGEIPDAKVESLTLKGNHDGWSADVPFTVVEAGKTFTLTYDLTGNTVITDGYWTFKIRPNAQDWVGFSQVQLTAPAWCEQARSDDNFSIDLENPDLNTNKFIFTATWAGGKQADEGWSLTIVADDPAGISNLRADAAQQAQYNLQGQRINANYRGLVLTNGKKYLKK